MTGALKTLYLGFYDYPYHGQAYNLNNGKFEKYELSDTEIDMLYYLYLANGDLLSWSNYWPYSREEISECLERISAIFGDIVVCSDSTFKHIELK